MINWAPPAEHPYVFLHERTHFPRPIRPLDWALNVRTMCVGFNAGFAHFGIPLRSIDVVVNGFVYEAIVPFDRGPHGATPVLAERALQVAIDDIEARWHAGWLPAISAHLDFWRAFDLRGASDAAFCAHLEETITRSNAMWVTHFEMFYPLVAAMSQFDGLCAEVLEGWGPARTADLLTGKPSKTTEGDEVLWSIGRTLHRDPALRAVLAGDDWPAMRAALGASASGEALRDAIDGYLDVYGRRGSDWSIDLPFWNEDPAPVLAILRAYAESDGVERAERRRGRAQRRAEAEALADAQLATRPAPIRAAFERLRRAALIGNWLSEESYHWIEGLGSAAVRGVCLEAGRRLHADGVLSAVDDVFYLDDVALLRAFSARDVAALVEQVARAKADAAVQAGLAPPEAIGESMGEVSAPAPSAVIARALDAFMGAPEENADDGEGLRGRPASAGVARGPVRVIRSLAEIGRVRLGDVVVASTTSPAWTPLFSLAAALVTDTGGALCHSAVVAREYGLPAVVGTGRATVVLRDGDWVEVDGGAGTVRPVEPAEVDAGRVHLKALAPTVALPSTRRALAELLAPTTREELMAVSRWLREGGPPPLLAEATAPDAPPASFDASVYDTYFGVRRTTANPLSALARLAAGLAPLFETAADEEAAATVRRGLADLFDTLCLGQEP